MDKLPLVSIIIPVYNGDSFLKKCVDSVLAQTYSNIEVLLVDDCSTDNTKKVIQGILSQDSRCRALYSKINMGAGPCRNWSIRESKGEYIIFVDSDDVIHPQLLEISIVIASKYSADVVEYGVVTGPEDACCFEKYNVTSLLVDVFEKCEIPRHINLFDDISCNKLFRKKHLLDCNVKFMGRVYEDTYFSKKSILCSSVAVFIHANMYFYTYRPNSNVNTFSSEKILPLLERDREVDELYLKCCVPLYNVLLRRFRADLFMVSQLLKLRKSEYCLLSDITLTHSPRLRFFILFGFIKSRFTHLAYIYLLINYCFLKIIHKVISLFK